MIADVIAVLETEEQRDELSEFYQQNKSRLFFIAYSKLQNKQDAEDAVQETFARIADKPEKFFEISHNKRVAFADVIVRNISVGMFKKANKFPVAELTDRISNEDFEAALEDKIISEISRAEILDFILKLPTLQRDILELKAIHGLSVQEIASDLKVTENVVRQRLFQARKKIADFLKGREML